MGFRSTFSSSDYDIEWPDWFREKYYRFVNIDSCLTSKWEVKLYFGGAEDLTEDIQKVLTEQEEPWDDLEFILLFLHECDGCTRCHITPEYIRWSEPVEWIAVDENTHGYCYGCSDVKGPGHA